MNNDVMLKEDLVSVIVPVYQVEKYIDRCLFSVTNQSYKNLEIIIVDDGSTDNSGEICKKYQLIDKRIAYYKKTNGGLSSARNYGILKSNANYICFVDSDDYISENYVKNMYNVMMANNSDICCCGVKMIYENTTKTDTYVPNSMIINGTEAVKYLFDKRSLAYVVAWNKLYRKELFVDNNFSEGLRFEDEDIMHRLYLNCKKICYIEDILYFYIKRNDSITMNKDYTKYYDNLYVLSKRCEYLSKKNKYLVKLAVKDFVQTYAGIISNKDIKCDNRINEIKHNFIYNNINRLNIYNILGFIWPKLYIKTNYIFDRIKKK